MSSFSQYVTSTADFIDPPERRLIEIEDENLNDTKIEKKLDKCRRLLMIGLALIGILYYIAFEFDGLESQSSVTDAAMSWVQATGAGLNRPEIAAPDPYKLPPPNDYDEPVHGFPRAYIIGAPRCGCHVLRQYMEHHPQMFFTDEQNMHFWDDKYSQGVEWYKQKIPAVKPWQISVDYTSEYLIKPEVPQRMIDELPNNQTRIIMMVCDPIERAELEFFEIFNNLDTNHADWKAKIDAVGDIITDFPSFADLYTKFLSTIRDNPSEVSKYGVRDFEDLIANIQTIRPEASILTTSLFDIHIRRWLRVFDRGNILIMDGRQLQTAPIVAVRRVQNFLRIEDTIPSKAFSFNATAGLFCIDNGLFSDVKEVVCPARDSFVCKLTTQLLQ